MSDSTSHPQGEQQHDQQKQQALLNIESLDNWLQQQGIKGDGDIAVERLAVGRSNEMYILSYDHDGQRCDLVLRRPAAVAWEKAEKVLRREYQLLNALSSQSVAVPEVVAICDDTSVIGVMFYLMKKVEGFVPAMGAIPAGFTDSDERIKQTAYAGLEAIAKIHSVDWRATGLGDFGKPDEFHQRQVGRWTAQLDSYGGRELPGLVSIGQWLQQHLPRHWTPTIMHGDYHPLNLLMAEHLPPTISAIVDWETSTIGDPFLDLVGFLDIWYDANAGIDWPDYDTMVAQYLRLVDFEPENMTYYRLLYYFRQSVLLEGIYQRSLQDTTREPMQEMASHVDRMIERAQNLLQQQ